MRQASGFSIVEVVVVLTVIGMLGIVGWTYWMRTYSNPRTEADKQAIIESGKDSSFIRWSFNGTTWQAAQHVPACEEPLAIAAPMDISQATAILMPGQFRGGDFKPHGGIGIDQASSNSLTVKAVRDAYLYRGSRYLEMGEVQYLLEFMDSCGIVYRFDHLRTLTTSIQSQVDTLPVPQSDDSRTSEFPHPLKVKKGEVVATEVGFKGMPGAFFDFGVYDLRQPNQASHTKLYQTDQQRLAEKEQSYFALCWLDLLPPQDRILVKQLPNRGGTRQGMESDYCQ